MKKQTRRALQCLGAEGLEPNVPEPFSQSLNVSRGKNSFMASPFFLFRWHEKMKTTLQNDCFSTLRTSNLSFQVEVHFRGYLIFPRSSSPNSHHPSVATLLGTSATSFLCSSFFLVLSGTIPTLVHISAFACTENKHQ